MPTWTWCSARTPRAYGKSFCSRASASALARPTPGTSPSRTDHPPSGAAPPAVSLMLAVYAAPMDAESGSRALSAANDLVELQRRAERAARRHILDVRHHDRALPPGRIAQRHRAEAQQSVAAHHAPAELFVDGFARDFDIPVPRERQIFTALPERVDLCPRP